MTFGLVNLETPTFRAELGAMWQEKMAVYLISWQFTDGFHITKVTIHPIPPSPRVHTPIITVLNRGASNYSLSSFSILHIYMNFIKMLEKSLSIPEK